jgi:lantibiotic biosynthesis protein
MSMNEARFLEAADRIGARLCRDAIWAGGRCNWLGDAMEFAEGRWQVVHRSFGPDLYGGTSGIALFLARLYSFTGDAIFRKAAEGAAACALSQMPLFDPALSFGFYSGATGIAYALGELATLFDRDDLAQHSAALLKKLPREKPAIQTWDIISGSAGMIPVLLKLHAASGGDFLLDLALQHGEMLLEGAHRNGDGWSWTTMPGPKDLTGFSHGTAGIGWALLELHGASREPRFLEAGLSALRYERRWYDAAQENWPDFRSDPQPGMQPICAVAWCHGAPGIGLSRIRAHQLLQEKECLTEATVAVRTTASSLSAALQSGQGNCCLCHGNMGNAELLLLAGDTLGHSDNLKLASQLADQAIQQYQAGHNPWPCGVLNGGENPGLMLGLAGIGYFFLRIFNREKTPSVMIVGPS